MLSTTDQILLRIRRSEPADSGPVSRAKCIDAQHGAVITAATRRRLLVGIFTDGTTKYGRSILLGITQYANLQRRWVLFKDLNQALNASTHWPQFDGIIYAGVPADTIQRCRENSRHMVSCSGNTDPALTPMVALDDRAAGAQGAEHLLDCRIEHFAFFGSRSGSLVADNRQAGFEAAVKARGLHVVDCPIPAPNASEWISHTHRPELVRWLRALPKPVGIMTYDDVVAHDLAETCLEADIGVPDHVAIVGVNNDELMCESAWPPLSSIETDHTRMGYHAAKMLDRLLSDETLQPSERQLLLPPLGVIRRQSTDSLALHDEHLVDSVRFIREHACDPCDVHDVLKVVPVNRRWLERQFLRKLGRTPHEEIRRVRIETAKRLFPQEDLTMPQIAVRCGFTELKSFYAAFRKVTGVTPAAFRRSRRTTSK